MQSFVALAETKVMRCRSALKAATASFDGLDLASERRDE
jgi:hypothetical protein